LPAKLSDLYYAGLVAQLDTFICPASSNRIVTADQIDSASDYILTAKIPAERPFPLVREKKPNHAGQPLACYSDKTVGPLTAAGDDYTIGQRLVNEKKFADAETALRRAVQQKPDDARRHNWLGFALYQQNKFRDAETEFKEAVRLQPDYHLFHQNLAGTYRMQKRLPEAEKAARRAIALGPKYAANWHELALVYAGAQQWADAEKAEREANRLDPKNPRYRNLLAAAREAKPLGVAGNATVLTVASNDARVIHLRFTPTGDKLLIATSIGRGNVFPAEVLLWDIAANRAQWRIPWRGGYDRDAIRAVGFWPDERTVTVAGHSRDAGTDTYLIATHDATTGRQLTATPVKPMPDQPVAWSPRGDCLAGRAFFQWEQWEIWDGRTGQKRQSIELGPNSQYIPGNNSPLAITADGRWLAATRGSDTTTALLLWDTQAGKFHRRTDLKTTLEPHALAIAPGDKTFALAGSWRVGNRDRFGVRVCDFPGGAQRHALDWPDPDSFHCRHSRLAFAPRADRLACALDQLVCIWRLTDGAVQQTIRSTTPAPTGEHDISALSFSPDGQTLTTGHHNGIVRLWRP